MSDYVLKPNEVLNGGYTVEIGSYTLRLIGGYEPSWTNEYDTQNSFTDYLGNQQKILLGTRFSLRIKTSRLDADEYNSLVAALKSETINVVCPDFEGECYCENIPGTLEQANFNGTRYTASFTLTANSLETAGGGL